jgi:NADP-dependent 3-hydroxy acid dehydrogenase YdfG
MGRDVIVATGASTGFGRLAAEALALAGHTVYASMQDVVGRNASQVDAVGYFAEDNGVDLRTVELDVQSQSSVDAAVEKVFSADGRIDVVVHNAGHMVFGPAEAFTPQQPADLYDIKCGRHAASQSGRTAAHATPAAGPARVGIQQQLSGWHAAVRV